MKKFMILALAAIAGVSAAAQDLTPQMRANINQLIDKRYKSDEPGGTVVIARNGKILYQRGFGMARLEQPTPMQPDMIFSIGSQTKQFTAVCALQLVEQGKLRVADKISRYIDKCPTSWQDITIENLLTHSSGISDVRGNNLSITDRIDTAKTRPLAYKPGTKVFYANIEFDLLGFILEKISGESIAVNIKKRIIEPLGLKNTYAPDHNMQIPGLVSCYIRGRDSSFYINNPNPIAVPVTGAGGLYSNTQDIAAWYEGLTNGKVIKKETLAKAWQPFILADGKASKYGYGWDAGGMVQGSPIAEHGGLSGGFCTDALYLIKEHIYVGVFLNQRTYADATAQELAAITLGKPYPDEIVNAMTIGEIQACAGVYKDSGGAEKRFNLVNGQLYYVPGGGALRSRFAFYDKDKFYLDNTLVEGEVVRDAQGKVTAVKLQDKRFPAQPQLTWTKTI
ncbi:MAG TPA: serine hydrolase domain-containing protein [Mucilaginibacter sp.]|nr:serine hydrolase domain-containing protein [Mucilaginibacter sp.]